MRLLALLLAVSCVKGRGHPPGSELSSPHVIDLSEVADAARLAVVAGHPTRARRHLTWIARHGFDHRRIARPLRPFANQLVDEAKAAREAMRLQALGEAVGRIGQACGACHLAAGRDPRFEDAEVAAGSDIVAHMARHQWGVDSLWEGLVAPRDELWTAGAVSFFEVPVDPEEEIVVPVAFAPLAEKVHALGTEALAVLDPHARAVLYGRLVAACGECHRALGGPPSPSISP